jgi:hypothetical protein
MCRNILIVTIKILVSSCCQIFNNFKYIADYRKELNVCFSTIILLNTYLGLNCNFNINVSDEKDCMSLFTENLFVAFVLLSMYCNVVA